METPDRPSRLERAWEFLLELMADGRSSPPEVEPVVEGYVSRLESSLRQFLSGRITGRELEAHAIQIRLSYAQDLSKLLAGV